MSPTEISALLLLLAGVHLAPDLLAAALGDSPAAWQYVAYGVEATVLWGVVACKTPPHIHMQFGVPVWPAALWGISEGMQRACCRPMLPMDRPPDMPPGTQLCEAAFGRPWGMAGLWLAMIVTQYLTLRGLGYGRP